MTAALEFVYEYIADARVLLQDKVAPYRYEDTELVTALNLTLLVARGLRPDLFMGEARDHHALTPQQFVGNTDDCVNIDPQFRQAIEYGLCAHAFLRDQEDIQDARAGTFYSLFTYLLTGAVLPFPGQGKAA